ncbi:DUF2690 domain-containing protein, partial [Streptomyces sp. OF3]
SSPAEPPPTGPPVTGVEVNCNGSACDGEDPMELGCGGDAWTSALSRVGGSYVEVRYSSLCRAGWARIKWARPGDRVALLATDGRRHREVVPDDRNRSAFTLMLGAPAPEDVKACWRLRSGATGCTDPGGTTPLPEA